MKWNSYIRLWGVLWGLNHSFMTEPHQCDKHIVYFACRLMSRQAIILMEKIQKHVSTVHRAHNQVLSDEGSDPVSHRESFTGRR